jgi:hypothetical protein
MHDKAWADPASWSGAPRAGYGGRRDRTSVKLIDNPVIIVLTMANRKSPANWRFDLHVGDDLRLDGELVGKVVTLGLLSFVVLSAIEIPTHL